MRTSWWTVWAKVVRMMLVSVLLVVTLLALSWHALGGWSANRDSESAIHGMRLVHSSEENLVCTNSEAAFNSSSV